MTVFKPGTSHKNNRKNSCRAAGRRDGWDKKRHYCSIACCSIISSCHSAVNYTTLLSRSGYDLSKHGRTGTDGREPVGVGGPEEELSRNFSRISCGERRICLKVLDYHNTPYHRTLQIYPVGLCNSKQKHDTCIFEGSSV